MNNKIKSILIVDDEEKIVEVLRAHLTKAGYVTYWAYDGKVALDRFRQCSPSIILLDLMLPDISGEELCKIIRQESRTPIIMLTAKATESNLLEGLNIGADDYITKPFSTKEVVARVGAVLRRTQADILVDDIIIYNNYLSIDSKNNLVKVNGNIVALTASEYKILITMAKSPKKIFSRELLIELAFDGNFDGFSRTIDSYIKNIRKKIEIDDKKIISTVYGLGYKFEI